MIETIYAVGTHNPETGETDSRLVSAKSVTEAAVAVAKDLEAEAIEEISAYPDVIPTGYWRIESCEQVGLLVSDDIVELV